MTDQVEEPTEMNIILEKGDGAIVLHPDGTSDFYVPRCDCPDCGGTTVSGVSVALVKLVIALQDEEVQALLDKKLEEEEPDKYNPDGITVQ